MTFTILLAGSSQGASGGDLTTLDAVRQFLQKQDGTTINQDPLTEALISRASAMIQNEIGREFVPASGTRSFPYFGGGYADLGDVRAVTAVTVDSDGDAPTALSAGTWRLRPANPQNGVYRRLYMPDYRRDRCRWDRVVEVVGDFGFPEVPADVEHACIVTVRDWLRSDVAFNDSGDRVTIGGDTISPRILTGLDHYRLPTV